MCKAFARGARGSFGSMGFCVCMGKTDVYFCQTLLCFDLELHSMILVCPFQLRIFCDAFGPVCSSLQHGDRRREGIKFGATKTYKIRFNLFGDVLVLSVRGSGGREKEYLHFFLALPTSCFSSCKKNKLNQFKAKS